MRAVAFAAAFALADKKNQFLSGPAAVQDAPNAGKEENVKPAVVSSEELNKKIDATAQAMEEGLTPGFKVAADFTEDLKKMLPENFEHLAADLPNISMDEIQKKMAEIKDSKLKQQIEDMVGGMFAQVDKNGDSKIDGEEVVAPMAALFKQFVGQSGEMLKQVQANLPQAMSGIADQVKTALAKVDRNQDGSIDADEVAVTIDEAIIEESVQDDEDADEDEEAENEEENDDEDDE